MDTPEDLFERFPQTDRFQLMKDGDLAEKVLLPVHIQSYDWALLSGSGDVSELQRVLKGQDLELTEMQPGSGLNVGIFAINYDRSDVGAFREYYFVVAAKDVSIAGQPVPQDRQLGFFVWDIQLDSDLAIRFGRQVWGHPKTYAEGEVGWRGADFTFEFRERAGASIFAGTCGGGANLPFVSTQFPPFYFITPYELRRSWAKAINEGLSASRPFEPETDRLTWNDESRLGTKLSRIQFQPSYWTLGRGVRAVGCR